jgi:hypothetical protein
MVDTQTLQERRIFERFDARFPAKLKDSREDYGEKVYLRNASAQGALLACKDHLYINDSVTLEVDVPQAAIPVTLRGRVMWVKKDHANFWEVGMKFHQISFMQLAKLYETATQAQT